MTIDDLKTMFPRSGKNHAVTGRIPISVFNEYEKDIRKIMRIYNLRAIYRGPRVSNAKTPWLKSNNGKAATTMRCDAVAVLLYPR